MQWGPTILFSMCGISTIFYTIYFLILPPEAWMTATTKKNEIHSVKSTVNKLEPKTTIMPTTKAKTQKTTLSAEFNRSIDQLWENRRHRMELIYKPGHSIVPSNFCTTDFGADRKIIIVVTSAPKNYEKRKVIRDTWVNFDKENVTVAFMLGTTFDSNITEKVQEESEKYNDLIVGNFHDSYSNLTLKSMSMLEWVNTYCFQAEFLFKTDDDMFINVKKLLSYAEERNQTRRAIYGRIGHGWKPNRDHSSKYYISKKQFAGKVFPDFITGPAYLIPMKLCRELYSKAIHQRFIKLEDVFFTGIVAQALKIQREGHKLFINRRVGFVGCNLKRYISFHDMKINDQKRYWRKFNNTSLKC